MIAAGIGEGLRGPVLRFADASGASFAEWDAPASSLAFDEAGVRACLLDLERPCYAIRDGDRIGVMRGGEPQPPASGSSRRVELLAAVPALPPARLGDPAFRVFHGVRLAYMAGSMANGIASEDLVIALGRAGILASFGAAGLVPARIEAAIGRIRQALPSGPYGFNLIHSPSEPALEQRAVDLYLRYGVRTVEASAFLDVTPSVVQYRLAGLGVRPDGSLKIENRVIAKVSRREVARKFMEPAPTPIVQELLAAGRVSAQQARLAEHVPLCDDLTVEADSGGHTDNRPLVCLLPSMLELRDEIQERHGYAAPIRIGAAGGIGTPASALAAFAMGAAYVVTGSINQACIEAGASSHTKSLLAQAEMADVMMAPAADMFEMGVKVQLLKRGTMFPMRAQWLYELYTAYDSLDAIPAAERERLERQVLRRPVEDVWRDTVAFFGDRDPEQLRRAANNPKRKLALIFRWYLGLASRWSNAGEPGRQLDYQIWCGPAMGAFNDWVRGTYLEAPDRRRVADVAEHLMCGAALLKRVDLLRAHGPDVHPRVARYRPQPLGPT